MHINEEFTINASTESVWEILATQYADVGRWTTAVTDSRPVDGPCVAGAPVAGRACNSSSGQFEERITEYDFQKRRLGYEVVRGLPFFVRLAAAKWRLRKLGAQSTHVTFDVRFEMPWVVEKVMGGMMRRQMGPTVNAVVRDLTVYAETGDISAAKREAAA